MAKGMKLGGGQGGKKKESTLDALMAEDKVSYKWCTAVILLHCGYWLHIYSPCILIN